MLKKLSKFQRLLNPEQPDASYLYLLTYAVLGLVSLVMTVMNLFTGKGPLTWCTGAFTLLSLLNVILTQTGPRTRRAAVALFSIEIIAMFSFFLVTGNPEGFSVIWICMLPSLGLFFFGRDRGSLLCGVMLLILLFFLWTPWGQSILTIFQHPNYTPSFHGYTDSFKMRFPVLFIAFYLMAFFLESMRLFAYREMSRMR